MQVKYKETVLYFRIYAELINAAQYQGLITYQDMAVIMGLKPKGSYMGKETGQILGEISLNEHQQARPMLSALAVGVSGVPGGGFYSFAKDLGYEFENTRESKLEFWRNQRKLLYDIWKK